MTLHLAMERSLMRCFGSVIGKKGSLERVQERIIKEEIQTSNID